MSTVYQVTLTAINNGVPHNNVFHVFDGNDNAVPFDIAAYFDTNYITPLTALTSHLMTWNGVEVKSLSFANPGEIRLSLIRTGVSIVDAMPTGVHMYVKLISLDTTNRSGGKLVGGGVEDEFVAGEPTAAYMDALQAIYDPFISGMDGAIGTLLAIYRPSLSIPGLPVVGIVASALVRGDSTNNRRHKTFER